MADISILQLPPTTYVNANDVTVVVQNGITKKVAASVFQSGITGPAGPAGPQGPQGLPGATGAAGPQGPTGPGGPQGATGPAGPAGTTGATGPQGPQGPQGTAATATAGTTTTGLPGSSASVVNAGTTSNAIFNFTIPRGDQGPSGPVGPPGAGVAPGGIAGQVLIKQSGVDYATAWGSVTGGLAYQGTWNALTNTPTLTSSVGSNGNYYVVDVAGTTNLNGITDWQIGDWAIFNGSVWQKIDQSNLVTSVNGQTGAVSLAYADLAGAIPTWNQNTTGTAANVTGVVALINGGTGATTAATARTNLGATTVGGNFFTLTNPSAITFPRINADNTVSALDAATFRTAIGAGTSSTTGTVTSVSGTGTVSGLTLTGTVTTSGSLTLGGTLAVTPSNFSSQTTNTFLAAPNGSAGVPSFRTIVAADVPTLNQNTTGTAANVTGTVAVANGGTGLTTAPTNGQIDIGSTGVGFVRTTLTAGTGVSITNAAGSITITATNAGAVTSVTGTSPVVSSGGSTPAISLATAYGDTLNPYGSKTANYILAAPNGSAGVPTFRAVVAADIPTLNQNTTGTAANVTGVVAIANGGTGQTTASAAFNALSPITTTGDLIVGNGTNSATRLPIGTSGYLLSSNGTTATWTAAPAAMVYPGAGIPNSTGSAWGTSYSTTGSGTVVALQTSALLTTPTLSGATVGNAAPWLNFANGSATTLAAGRMWYNGTDGSWNLGMGGGNITQQVGEELFRYGKASAAITDSPLQLVYKTGVVGASGEITFAPAVAGITDSNNILGCATENIALNAFGRITTYGVIHNITTNGSAYGEVWVDNDDIYYNPVTGGLTKTYPTAPGLKMMVGTVINAGSGGSGSFIVKLGVATYLSKLSDVQITSVANSNLLQYDSALQYWKNVAPSTVTVGNVSGVVAIANGGSGQTTAQLAMNAFAGAVTSGSYLRGNGTNVVMSTIQAADVPTLNQNTTGTAANVTGIVAIANGGTNSTATPTAGGAGYGTGTAHAYTAAGTAGQVLTSAGAGAPVWSGISGGTF